MNIADALNITAPLTHRCIDCGAAVLEPTEELCRHCAAQRYADSDADQIPASWQEQAAEDAGINRWGPL